MIKRLKKVGLIFVMLISTIIMNTTISNAETTGLIDLSFNLNGYTVEFDIEHQNKNSIMNLEAEYVDEEGRFVQLWLNPTQVDGKTIFSSKIPVWEFREKNRNLKLNKLVINRFDGNEIYFADTDELLKNGDFVLKTSDNPYNSVKDSDMKYEFTSQNKYIIVNKDSGEHKLDNMRIYTDNPDLFYHPVRIDKNPVYDSNGKVEEDVLVDVLYYEDFTNKYHTLKNVPAKVIDIDKDLESLDIKLNGLDFEVNIKHKKLEDVKNIKMEFASKTDDSIVIYKNFYLENLMLDGNSLTLKDKFNIVEFTNEVTDFYLNEIIFERTDFNERYLAKTDVIIKDKIITLDPKDSPIIDIKTENIEWNWNMYVQDYIKIQKDTGISDILALDFTANINDSYFYLEAVDYEIINNPGLDSNIKPDEEILISADITFRGNNGIEKVVRVNDIPAKVIIPKGTIVNLPYSYREFAIHYKDYENGTLPDSVEFYPRKDIILDVVYPDGKKGKLNLGRTRERDTVGIEGVTPCIHADMYKFIGVDYIIDNSMTGNKIGQMNYKDGFFYWSRKIYVVDQGKNLVNEFGQVVAPFDKRKDIEYISSSKNVFISSKEGAIPTYTEMEVKENTELDNVFKDETYVAYDMNLYADDELVQPVDDVKVGIEVPSYMEGKEVSVVYVNDAGEKEVLDTTVENGIAYFTTDHFSTYALVSEEVTITVPEIDETSDLENLDIKNGDVVLKYNKDYKYTVKTTPSEDKNFVDVVEVTFEFINDYSGFESVVRTYEVEREKPDVFVPEVDENTDIKDFGIKDGDYYLVYDKDYSDAGYILEDPNDKSCFEITVIIKFIGDYEGLEDVVRKYSVKKPDPTVNIPEINGLPDVEKAVIKFNDIVLVKDKDYKIVSTEKDDIITVTVEFIGDYDWAKSVVKTYEIPFEPDIIISEINKDTDLDKLVIKDNDKVLVKDKDYTITKVEKDGLVTVTIDFIGKYDEVESIVKSYKVETDSEDKPVPPTEDKDDNVQTDDTTNVAMLFTVMLLSGAGFILLNRKNKKITK